MNTRTATSTGAPVRRPWRLSASARKLTLTVHIITAIGWIGVDFVLFVFAFRGLTTDDPATLKICYQAVEMFAVILLVPLGLLSLASGLLLAWGSKYGILRYRWVFWKLVLNLVLTTLVLVLLRPGVSEAADLVSGTPDLTSDQLDQARSNLIFPPVVSITALSFATVLAVYKPWGRTKYGQRRLESERHAVRGGS